MATLSGSAAPLNSPHPFTGLHPGLGSLLYASKPWCMVQTAFCVVCPAFLPAVCAGAPNAPGRVRGPLLHKVVSAVAAGREHALAATADGQLYSFGGGRATLGRDGPADEPRLVAGGLDGLFIRHVAAGEVSRHPSLPAADTSCAATRMHHCRSKRVAMGKCNRATKHLLGTCTAAEFTLQYVPSRAFGGGEGGTTCAPSYLCRRQQ